MITIISATNRTGSRSLIVAEKYLSLLYTLNTKAQLLSLENVPHDFAFTDLYGHRTEAMQRTIEQYVSRSEKFVFIVPEYNGSFPGVLKTFIDAIPPREFRDKKAGIVGVSDGRAGNLRGQEHLTGILHYLKVHVHYSKPKLSSLEHLINEQKNLTDEAALRLLADHAQTMVSF